MSISQHEKSHGLFFLCLFGFLALYAASYATYRHFGPVQYHWPRDSTYPIVLCRTESNSDVLMAHLFRPCIELEDAFYRFKYRKVKRTLDDWVAMESTGQQNQ